MNKTKIMSIIIMNPFEYSSFLHLVSSGTIPKTWYKVLSHDSDGVEIQFSSVVNVALAFHIGKLFQEQVYLDKIGGNK